MTHPTPELQQIDLDDETLAAYVRDLRAVAENVQALVETATGRFEVSLDTFEAWAMAVQDAGRPGRLLRARLRYRFDGRDWLDILCRRGEERTLVRTELADFEADRAPHTSSQCEPCGDESPGRTEQ